MQELGRARIDAYQRLSLYCAAGMRKEKLIRDNELKAAMEAAAKDPHSITLAEEVDRIASFASMLHDHVDDLILARARFINNSQRLKEQIKAIKMGRRKIKLHMTMGLQQQEDAVAGIGFSLQSGDMAAVLKSTDEFTTKADEWAALAQDMVTDIINESLKQGVNKEEAVVKAIEKTIQQRKALTDQRIKAAKEKPKTREIIAAKLDELSEVINTTTQIEAKLAITKATGNTSDIKAIEDQRKSLDKKAPVNTGKKPAASTAKPDFNQNAQPAQSPAAAPEAAKPAAPAADSGKKPAAKPTGGAKPSGPAPRKPWQKQP
jgi:hypothetical protein